MVFHPPLLVLSSRFYMELISCINLSLALIYMILSNVVEDATSGAFTFFGRSDFLYTR
jgi:hypothetical protein